MVGENEQAPYFPRVERIVEEMETAGEQGEVQKLYELGKKYERTFLDDIAEMKMKDFDGRVYNECLELIARKSTVEKRYRRVLLEAFVWDQIGEAKEE